MALHTGVLALVPVDLQGHYAAVNVVAKCGAGRVGDGATRGRGRQGTAEGIGFVGAVLSGAIAYMFKLLQKHSAGGGGTYDDCLSAYGVDDAGRGEEGVGEVADVHLAAAAHGENGLNRSVTRPRGAVAHKDSLRTSLVQRCVPSFGPREETAVDGSHAAAYGMRGAARQKA